MPALTALLLVLKVALQPALACDDPVHVYAAGRLQRQLCPAEASAAGLTIVDLRDDWAPYSLDGAARDVGAAPPAYREVYIELANGRFGDDPLAAEDRYLELFGITPTFSLIHTELDDEARHRCHEAIDDAPLVAAEPPIRRETRDRARARQADLTKQRALVGGALKRLKLADRAALAAHSRANAALVARFERAEALQAAIDALQAHLVCDRLLPPKAATGAFDVATSIALRAYQRRHVIVASGELDAETKAALLRTSREQDLRLALRALRQRVTDAAGLIEDGSARGEWGTVLGRALDGPALQYQGVYPPLPGGAPDRISPATEAAARAFGWTDFASAQAFIHRHFEGPKPPPRFAVALPAPPAYYARPLELRAEIDRGQIWYEHKSRHRRPERRAVLILYASSGPGEEVALIRWPTTVGGWQEEKLKSGRIVVAYKGSDVGPRIWRDLVVAPVWYPPRSTPDAELVRYRAGAWELKSDLLGPSYRSAYGMAMLIHHRELERDGQPVLYDNGIRSHGAVNYRSILLGQSHGCHRLYNHHILRLTAFLLQHHGYSARGPAAATVRRTLRHKRRAFPLALDDRGFYFELQPPIPVDVLEGEIMGKQKQPSASKYRPSP
jgi:hypothetical protein